MKRCATVVAALAVLVSQSACYTTRIVTEARPEGPPLDDRQWFTIGGLVPLSQPAGHECRNGLSYAESKLSGTDWLINVGLGLVGGIVGGVACSGTDAATRSYCISGGAGLVPFLVSSRTVNYACAAGGEGPPPANFHPASPPTP